MTSSIKADALSSFKSKTPMAFELSAVSKQTNDLGPGAFLNPIPGNCDQLSTLQCFGAKAERLGWHRPKDLPFVEPSSSLVPGPGSYGNENSSFCCAHLENPTPFLSTDMRPCLKPVRGSSTRPKSPYPGPGDYNLESDSIIKKTSSRGIFGSCTSRFDPHCLPPEVTRFLAPLCAN